MILLFKKLTQILKFLFSQLLEISFMKVLVFGFSLCLLTISGFKFVIGFGELVWIGSINKSRAGRWFKKTPAKIRKKPFYGFKIILVTRPRLKVYDPETESLRSFLGKYTDREHRLHKCGSGVTLHFKIGFQAFRDPGERKNHLTYTELTPRHNFRSIQFTGISQSESEQPQMTREASHFR